jgi:hypothetical protein
MDLFLQIPLPVSYYLTSGFLTIQSSVDLAIAQFLKGSSVIPDFVTVCTCARARMAAHHLIISSLL